MKAKTLTSNTPAAENITSKTAKKPVTKAAPKPPVAKPTKPVKAVRTKREQLSKSAIVKGLVKGGKVKFTSSALSLVAPKQVLTGVVLRIQVSPRMKQEVLQIGTTKGRFWKASKSVTLVKAKV